MVAKKTTAKVKAETEPQGEAFEIKKPVFERFSIWIVGETPLICHAWAEKAKREMLGKQLKEIKPGRATRDPEQDFIDTLYSMGQPNAYGFPATGVKNSILTAGHKDKGLARSAVRGALWIAAEMTPTRPAMAGATCNLPLIRIWGSDPVMREDMVRIGSGLSKTANLAYRSEFFPWAMRLTGRVNPYVLSVVSLGFLIQEAGLACGIGEWRNERNGMFGSYRPAADSEVVAWENFSQGKGPLPHPVPELLAAE